ncbi:MAG: polysaccharide biosynthesis C-terminal domain-containing protein [Pyrinomonadaceae bacterium]
MIVRNVKLVFVANAMILFCGVVTSLLSAWALGPAGRGDLLVVTLWPPVCALLVTFGLDQAHRYWVAKDPECASTLFSNAILFALTVGPLTVALSELVIPHVVGERSPETMRLVRIYLVNIPAALTQFLMIGLLEGARRFGWAGASRLMFFVVQAVAYFFLWIYGRLTLESAALTLILAQFGAMSLSLFAVLRELKPHWQPSWSKWKAALGYGVRDYPGIMADFTTLRLDQLLLGGMASSAAIGLYFIAVRLSEMVAILASSIADALMPEVAASEADRAERLLGRSLRLTLYTHLLAFVPLWIGAPYALRYVYGENFLAATSTLRILLLASVVLSAGGIMISGLRGFGNPGLATIARLASAVVTVVSLLLLLPRLGIVGAAVASLLGYSMTMLIGLFWLLRKTKLGFWGYLRPRYEDIPITQLRTLLQLEPLRARSLET